MSEGEAALADVVAVSRETSERLTAFVALLKAWQGAQNLVAPATLDDVWRRHIADSAQLLALHREPAVWADLGTGGGFPGLVVAILLAEHEAGLVHLIDSNARKCAFLRRAVAETGARAKVHHGRIEAVLAGLEPAPSRISARAVAPLPELLRLAAPALAGAAVGSFHKGQDFALEIQQASQSWDFDLVQHHSRIESGSVILDVAKLRPARGGR